MSRDDTHEERPRLTLIRTEEVAHTPELPGAFTQDEPTDAPLVARRVTRRRPGSPAAPKCAQPTGTSFDAPVRRCGSDVPDATACPEDGMEPPSAGDRDSFEDDSREGPGERVRVHRDLVGERLAAIFVGLPTRAAGDPSLELLPVRQRRGPCGLAGRRPACLPAQVQSAEDDEDGGGDGNA